MSPEKKKKKNKKTVAIYIAFHLIDRCVVLRNHYVLIRVSLREGILCYIMHISQQTKRFEKLALRYFMNPDSSSEKRRYLRFGSDHQVISYRYATADGR